MTLFSSLNQYGVFCLNLLLGVAFGAVSQFVLFLVEKIKNNVGLKQIVEILLYVIFAVICVAIMAEKVFIDFGLYIPLSALLGILTYNYTIKKLIDFKH